MPEQQRRKVAGNKGRPLMLITLAILLGTLALILVRDPIWFGANETLDADETSPGSVPNSAAQAPSAHNPASTAGSVPSGTAQVPSISNPAPTARTKNEGAAQSSAESQVAGAAVIAATRTEVPSMEVEVVAGDTHRTVHPGNNSVKVEMPPNSGSQAAGWTAFGWSPATNAAERTRMSSDEPEVLSPSVELSYPALAQQMKVQGSVLLQAFVGADGGIRDLRVLSGPAILVSAALEAARQWRFKPYLHHGQPVETQAKIIVNFTIRIL
jgi:TonB family protein